MVQVLKESVRIGILEAAERLFARVGFKKATMEAIAREAGVATGTIYKYFANKDALFYAIITDDFAADFFRLTRRRILEFATPEGLQPEHPALDGASGELLQFWIRNRLKVVIILARAEGSKYEKFAEDYVEAMVAQTIEQAREQFPEQEITPLFRFMVRKILTESVRGIVATLETFTEASAINQAFSAGVAYQLGGIAAFIEWWRREASA